LNGQIFFLAQNQNNKCTFRDGFNVRAVPFFLPFNRSHKHYFLFDEVDGYKKEQQQRLKGWMNRDDIVCVMTTNHLDKIDKSLLSRSHLINFNASSNTNDYVIRMKRIILQNNLTMLSDSTLVLFKINDLSKRDHSRSII
jgi:replication-associated recombination protein RarA